MAATDLGSATRAIDEQGFVVIPDLLDSHELDEARAALADRLASPHLGRNNFEGFATERVYSLVAAATVFERLVEHPTILGICDALLEPNYLLTASQAIQIFPGETEQPFHTDDSFYRIPRPRPAVSVSTIVAIDAFTRSNGATQVVVGSHRWDDARIDAFLDRLPTEFAPAPPGSRRPRAPIPLPVELARDVRDVTMEPGSAVVFLGTLLHRGGANRSERPRLAVSNQYCAPWARQQENFVLSVPRERAANMSRRVQAMLGYSIHPPFMGHVAGVHPLRTLTDTESRAGRVHDGASDGVS